MGNIKTGGTPFTPPTTHAVKPPSSGPTIKSAPSTAAPAKSNPEAFKSAQHKSNQTVAGGHHGSGHGSSAVYGDEHKAHDKPAVVSHKTHLAHGAAEGLVVAGEKAAHILGHGKTGHAAHVIGHGAHKLAAKISPIGAIAATANAIHNPSVKTGGEALSTSLTAGREVIQAGANKAAATAASKAAEKVLVQAGGRSANKATTAIVKAEAPKVAAAIAKKVGTGTSAAAVVKAGETAAATLVKSGIPKTASVVAKAAPKAAVKAAQAAGVAAAKAGGRFVPGLNVAIAATDAVVAGADIKKAYDKPTTKNVTVAVVSGLTAACSGLAASNVPVVSQIGAGASIVTGVCKAALESFWPD